MNGEHPVDDAVCVDARTKVNCVEFIEECFCVGIATPFRMQMLMVLVINLSGISTGQGNLLRGVAVRWQNQWCGDGITNSGRWLLGVCRCEPESPRCLQRGVCQKYIAFGLKAVDVTVTMPDSAGGSENVENALSKIPGVSSVEVTGTDLLQQSIVFAGFLVMSSYHINRIPSREEFGESLCLTHKIYKRYFTQKNDREVTWKYLQERNQHYIQQ